jgi:hypothetical protein
VADIKVGKRQVKPDTPAHVKGIKEGNSKGNYERNKGHVKDGRATAARSTGVNVKEHEPIDPRMPNLSPP